MKFFRWSLVFILLNAVLLGTLHFGFEPNGVTYCTPSPTPDGGIFPSSKGNELVDKEFVSCKDTPFLPEKRFVVISSIEKADMDTIELNTTQISCNIGQRPTFIPDYHMLLFEFICSNGLDFLRVIYSPVDWKQDFPPDYVASIKSILLGKGNIVENGKEGALVRNDGSFRVTIYALIPPSANNEHAFTWYSTQFDIENGAISLLSINPSQSIY